MSASSLTTSTLSPLTRTFRTSRQLNAVPGETGGAAEPADDIRPMTDTATTRHSLRRVSTGSRNSQAAHHERQRIHERGGSKGRRRAKRPERPPDVASQAIGEVDPHISAVLANQMKEASWAVHMSVSEAAALQSRLADSHTEVSALLHTCQATAEREIEQATEMATLKVQLQTQATALIAAASYEAKAMEAAAAQQCRELATQCEQLVLRIAAEADTRLLAANALTQ